MLLLQVNYDKSATEVDLLQPAFTRRREVFVGRLAMVGFVSAVLGEVSPNICPKPNLQFATGS